MAEKPRVDPALVEDFVRVAHGDLERTRALIEREEAILVSSCRSIFVARSRS